MKASRKNKYLKKQKKTRPTSSIPWLAMGTLMAYTAAGGDSAWMARAQTAASANQQPLPQVEMPVQRFDIAAGPLDIALHSFEAKSQFKIVVHLPEGTLPGFNTKGASGLYTPEQALRKLLAGTGLTFRATGPQELTVEIRATETVEVVGKPDTVAISKMTETVLDTPQTINVVSPEVIRDQASTTLRDELRNVAGISLAAGEGGAQGDNLTIRGFTARNDIFLDGMRDFGSYYRDPFDQQQVEVLQGPSAVVFGRGSTGGAVNQESKMPALARFIGGTLNFGTDATKRITADINEPIPALGSGTAFRLNVVAHDSGVAGRDIAESRRVGIAPSLAFGLNSATRVTLSYFHQTADDTPDYGIPWLFNAPAPVNRKNYYGFRDGNFLKTNVDIGTIKIEHDVNKALTFRNQVRYGNYTRDARITEGQIRTTVTGGPVTLATPLDQIAVNRNQITVNSSETFLYDQMDMTAHFQTGRIRHTLVAGVEGGRETSDPIRTTFTGVPTTSLLNPNPDQPFAGVGAISSNVDTTALSVGAYVIDTVKLGEKWELDGGLRWDRFDANFQQHTGTPVIFNRIDQKPGVRAAVLYKPVQKASIYFDYTTSFNPSAEALSLSAATANTPPETNKSYEAGFKWETGAERMSIQTAVFRTDKDNAREPDPTNPLLTVLGGSQRVDGIVVQYSGRIASKTRIYSGYAYLNGRVISSQFFPAAVGAQLANVPRNTFNVWTTQELPWKFTIGGGSNFVDSRTASSTVPTDPTTGLVKELPGYWLVNAMLRYRINERTDLQANLNNLTNKYYYDQIHPAHIVPGAGRSALVGLNFHF